MITRKIIPNIFENADDRISETLDIGKGTVASLVPEEYADGKWRVLHSRYGQIDSDKWGDTDVIVGDEIIITPVIEDPVSSTIGFIVAGIEAGIEAAAAYAIAHPFLAAFFALTAISGVYGVYTALTYKAPTFGQKGAEGVGGDFADDSPAYAWSGPETTASVEMPVPIIYGKNKVGGNIVNAYTESHDNKDWLNLLVAIGEGPLESIGGLTADADSIRPMKTLFGSSLSAETGSAGGGGLLAGEQLELHFGPVNCLGLDKDVGYLVIDLKCSDPTALQTTGDNQLELSSSGGVDANEWHYDNPMALGITDEWQTFTIPLADFDITGGDLDVTHINYFRWYNRALDNKVVTLYATGAKIKFGDTALEEDNEDITIEGNPVANYPDVELSVRMGSDTQTAMPHFSAIHRQKSLEAAAKLTKAGGAQTWTLEYDDTQGLVVHYQLPGGLLTTPGTSGLYRSWSVVIKREYRAVGDVAWTDYGNVTITDKRSALIQGTFEIGAAYPDTLSAEKYQIRLTRVSDDPTEEPTGKKEGAVPQNTGDFYVTAIDEIAYQEMAYPNTALLGIRALATDRLSGTLPQLTIIVEGLQVNDWTGDSTQPAYSNNPAVVLYDFLNNARYGAGDYLAGYLNETTFAASETYCDEEVDLEDAGSEQEARFTCDIILDGASSVPDVIARIAATCHCIPFWSGGTINPIIDKSETPTQLFTMGNIIEGSFKGGFSSAKERYNCIEVQFLNAANDYEREVIEIMDEDAIVDGDPLWKKGMFLAGVTKLSRAVRIGRQVLNQGKYSLRPISFRAGIDAIACQAGDVISFAHDVPQWGDKSGRVRGGAADTITCKEIVVLESLASGETYAIKVRHNVDDSIETATIISGAGTYDPGDSIQVSANWDTVPVAYDVYTIGQTSAKPFRIASMSRANDGEVEMNAIEYSENVYGTSGTLLSEPVYSNLPDPRRPPPHVENLTVVASREVNATAYVSYSIPRRSYWDDDTGTWVTLTTGFVDHVEIYLRGDKYTDNYALHGIAKDNDYEMPSLIPGYKYWIKAVSVSKWGIRSPMDSAPVVEFTLELDSLPPNVRGLELRGQANDVEFMGRDAVFAWHENSPRTADWPAGQEPLGAAQGGLSPNFKDYRVQILVDDIVVRDEYVQDNLYIYSYDKNVVDNTIASRSFTIKVWARDKFNQMSRDEAILDVSNPYPVMTDVSHPTVADPRAYPWVRSERIRDETGFGTGVYRMTSRRFYIGDIIVGDYIGIRVYHVPSDEDGIPIYAERTLIYVGNDSTIEISDLQYVTGVPWYYFIVEDSFGYNFASRSDYDGERFYEADMEAAGETVIVDNIYATG